MAVHANSYLLLIKFESDLLNNANCPFLQNLFYFFCTFGIISLHFGSIDLETPHFSLFELGS